MQDRTFTIRPFGRLGDQYEVTLIGYRFYRLSIAVGVLFVVIALVTTNILFLLGFSPLSPWILGGLLIATSIVTFIQIRLLALIVRDAKILRNDPLIDDD
jgi:hypothetical protein